MIGHCNFFSLFGPEVVWVIEEGLLGYPRTVW